MHNDLRYIAVTQPNRRESIDNHECNICHQIVSPQNLTKLVNNDIVSYTLYHPNSKNFMYVEAGEILFGHRKCAFDSNIQKLKNETSIPTYPIAKSNKFLAQIGLFKLPEGLNITHCKICQKPVDNKIMKEVINQSNSKRFLYDINFNKKGSIKSGESVIAHNSCAIATEIENSINIEEAIKQANEFLEQLSQELLEKDKNNEQNRQTNS